MEKAVSFELMIVVLELRLAARDVNSLEPRLSEQRLLELADIVENAVLHFEALDMRHEITVLTALGQRLR